MGKCSICGNKIMYNAYKKVKGVIYCLKCVPKEEAKFETTALTETIKNAGVDFDELQKVLAMSEKPKRKRKVEKHKKTSIKKGD